MKNKLKESIKTYKSFIKKGLVDYNISFYKKEIKIREKLLKQISDNKFTPNKFNKLNSRLKWDVYPLLKNVTWMCINCNEIDTNIRKSQPFPGSAICCGNCDVELTSRTGGGQNDPFNWTFKKNKERIYNEKK